MNNDYKDEPFGETDYPDYPLFPGFTKRWCDGCMLVIVQNETGLCAGCQEAELMNAK
jgi:hypothetical protein